MLSVIAQTTVQVENAGIGIGMLIFEIVLGLAYLAFYIWVLLQILKPSDAAWAAAGQNKGLWIGLWVVGLCCFGLIIALVFLFAIRPKLQEAEQAGGYGV